MALSPGTRLGPFEITAQIGVGGMGEVYRAIDTNLKRPVAIKVLPEAFSLDAERLARFQREAEVLASLNHPNIATIHGLERANGATALVMELVEGPTLADRIAQGPLPVDEALPIAKQIAEALEAAHEQGIIHRDLKPANIKLRPDGQVKILDFGLAKAFTTESVGPSSAALTNSPTLTSPIGVTGVGIILGTAAYMAPEQAKGKAVDRRADIWAFGVVLFEMLSGRRAFDGEDTTEVLGAVVRLEPDWKALPPAVPPRTTQVIRACLQKPVKQRIADMQDVRLALDGAFSDASLVAQVHEHPLGVLGSRARVAMAGLVGAALTGIVAAVLWPPGPELAPVPSVNRFTVSLPTGMTFRDNVLRPMVFTADGRRLLLNVSSGGTDRVFLRPMDQVQLQPVHGLEGIVGTLFLSPDAEWIGFYDGRGSLKRMRLAGGPPATIGETGLTGSGFQGATWGVGGSIVFATTAYRGLMEVPAAGGIPKPRTTKAGDAGSHQHPHFLPDGRSLLLTVRDPGQPGQIAYLPAGASEPVVLLEGTDPQYVATGRLLFAREAAIWAVRFDATSGRATGDPIPVLEGVSIGSNGIARMTVSGNGTLAYTAGGGLARSIVRVDRQGREEALPGLPPNTYNAIRVSPDGTRLAFEAGNPPDIWTYDLARVTATRVTTDPAVDAAPLWTPDGKRLVFLSNRHNNQPNVYWQNADGTGTAEPFLSQPADARMQPDTWSSDGKTLLLTVGRGGSADVGAINVDGERRVRDVIAMPSVDVAAALSPNGRWLAYQSDLSGTMEIYVERFPELGDRQKISTSGGASPRWSRDGKTLFYQSPEGRSVWSVSISDKEKLMAGTPQRLFEGSYMPLGPTMRPFDVAPDGRFLLIKSAPVGDPNTPVTIVVVENWLEELKRLVPAN